MITKKDCENFAEIVLVSISILMCSIGLSLAIAVIIWRIVSPDSNSNELKESDRILNSLSAFFAVLSFGITFSALVIIGAKSFISRKICSKLQIN